MKTGDILLEKKGDGNFAKLKYAGSLCGQDIFITEEPNECNSRPNIS